MSLILALPTHFDFVTAQMALSYPTLISAFGWREPHQFRGGGSAPRCLYVPGDDQSGEAGEDSHIELPGRPVRPLATMLERFTVYLAGVNTATPRNERSQYTATRQLYDCWRKAVYFYGRQANGSHVTIDAINWISDDPECRFGATIRVLGVIESMIPDVEVEVKTAPTDFTLTVHWRDGIAFDEAFDAREFR